MRVHLKHLVFRFYKSFFKSQGLTQIEIEPLNHTAKKKKRKVIYLKGSNDIKILKPHGLCCGGLQIGRRWVINVGIWKNFSKWKYEMKEKGTNPEELRDPNHRPHRAKVLPAHHGKPSMANRQDHRVYEDKGTVRCRAEGTEGLSGKYGSDGNARLLEEGYISEGSE